VIDLLRSVHIRTDILEVAFHYLANLCLVRHINSSAFGIGGQNKERRLKTCGGLTCNRLKSAR
jgi:hypothetical protein